MRLSADQTDRAIRIYFADSADRSIGSHPTTNDQVCVMRHGPPVFLKLLQSRAFVHGHVVGRKQVGFGGRSRNESPLKSSSRATWSPTLKSWSSVRWIPVCSP